MVIHVTMTKHRLYLQVNMRRIWAEIQQTPNKIILRGGAGGSAGTKDLKSDPVNDRQAFFQ